MHRFGLYLVAVAWSCGALPASAIDLTKAGASLAFGMTIEEVAAAGASSGQKLGKRALNAMDNAEVYAFGTGKVAFCEGRLGVYFETLSGALDEFAREVQRLEAAFGKGNFFITTTSPEDTNLGVNWTAGDEFHAVTHGKLGDVFDGTHYVRSTEFTEACPSIGFLQ